MIRCIRTARIARGQQPGGARHARRRHRRHAGPHRGRHSVNAPRTSGQAGIPAQPGPGEPGSAARLNHGRGPAGQRSRLATRPYARAALRPIRPSRPSARLSLLSLSANATYRGRGSGRWPASRHSGCTGPAITRRAGWLPKLAWLQALRAGTRGCSPPRCFAAVDGREIVDIEIGQRTRQCACCFEFLPGGEPASDELEGKFELLGGISRTEMHRHARERGSARPGSTDFAGTSTAA